MGRGAVAAAVAVCAVIAAACLPVDPLPLDPTPDPTALPDPTAPGSGALGGVGRLAVAAEVAAAGYDRGDFAHRSRHLCAAGGVDPYTALAYSPGDCDVDHVVSAREAWESGAWEWGAGRRADFGADPANLTPSKSCVNRSKGAGDAAEWPGRVVSGQCAGAALTDAGRCWWASVTVAVKLRWSLSVDPAERDALTAVLAAC